MSTVLSLDSLAEVCAGQTLQPTDKYERCFKIITHEEFYESELRPFFTTPSGSITLASLREKFTQEEIGSLITLLEWHFLLVYGHTLSSEDDFHAVKKELTISSWLDLISPGENSKLAMLYKMLSDMNPQGQAAYREFLQIAKKTFDKNSSPSATAETFSLVFRAMPKDVMELQLSALSPNIQRGWAFFASILAHFTIHEKSIAELFLQNLKDDAKVSTANELKTFLLMIVDYIEKGGETHVPKLAETPFMENAGNSCYIDSTLIPLFLLLKSKLHLLEKKFPAQEALSSVFNALLTDHEAKRDLVQKLRDAMQAAFPEKFINSLCPVQEDAGEFLSAILDHVLALDEPQKRVVTSHSFIDQDPHAVRDHKEYNYKEALERSDVVHETSLLDISFPDALTEGITLGSLVSCSRSHGIMNRQVEKFDGSKEYAYIRTEYTEQYMVRSAELAPEFLCIRLLRFTQEQAKRFDIIVPDDTISIASLQGDEPPVQYDLMGACIHKGDTIHQGHYYSMFYQDDKLILCDDLQGHKLLEDKEEGKKAMSSNGYIFFYRLCSTKN